MIGIGIDSLSKMSMFITIWLSLTGIYYLCAAVLRIAVRLPMTAVFILALPAMPFIVAYRNRKEHPIQAKTICWGWNLIYIVLIASCFIG